MGETFPVGYVGGGSTLDGNPALNLIAGVTHTREMGPLQPFISPVVDISVGGSNSYHLGGKFVLSGSALHPAVFVGAGAGPSLTDDGVKPTALAYVSTLLPLPQTVQAGLMLRVDDLTKTGDSTSGMRPSVMFFVGGRLDIIDI